MASKMVTTRKKNGGNWSDNGDQNSGNDNGSENGQGASGSFVKVSGQRFTLDGNDFKMYGTNEWQLVENPGKAYGLFQKAKGYGMNTVRAWTHMTHWSTSQDQENALNGLDEVIKQAKDADIRLILVLVDNWQYSGSIDEYLDRAGADKENHETFFTGGQPREEYKKWISRVVNRQNSKTGLTYKNDPTILAWDLINEPRCTNCSSGAIPNWISEMSCYLKSQDPNHLVTVGEEGFFNAGSPWRTTNPANAGCVDHNNCFLDHLWAEKEGQDFVKDHNVGCIDFAAFHLWNEEWNVKGPCCGDGSGCCDREGAPYVTEKYGYDFSKQWIQAHAEAITNMPVVLEESHAGDFTGFGLAGVLVWKI